MNTITTSLAACKPVAFVISTLGSSTHDFKPALSSNAVGPIAHTASPTLRLKPRATNPVSDPLPAEHGIYQFEISNAGSTDLSSYIGETTNLRGRMTQYGEMVRALIALHEGHRVVLDPNAYRYIHYAIADALLRGQNVTVRFDNGPRYVNGQFRKREELLALTDIVRATQLAGKFSLVLNCMGTLKAASPSLLSNRWQAVQTLL